MKKLALLSIVAVAVFTSGVQAKKSETRANARTVEFCNHWKHDIQIGFTKNPDNVTMVKGGTCAHMLSQEKGESTFVVINGMMHPLKRSFPNKRIVDANAHKAARGKGKNITVRYIGNHRDVYNWDAASKMFVTEQQ